MRNFIDSDDFFYVFHYAYTISHYWPLSNTFTYFLNGTTDQSKGYKYCKVHAHSLMGKHWGFELLCTAQYLLTLGNT